MHENRPKSPPQHVALSLALSLAILTGAAGFGGG